MVYLYYLNQWGAIKSTVDLYSATFPTSFSSACYAIFTQIAGPSRTSGITETGDNQNVVNITKTGFKLYARSGERQDTVYYLALGQ